MTSYGQKTIKIPTRENPNISYPVAGSDLLQNEYQKAAQFLKEHPDYFNQQKLKKAAAWNFTNGSTMSWLAYNFTNQTEYSVSSKCKAVGTNCYVFVADDVWGTYVDSAAVLSVVNDFDNKTPANPNKGIFQTDVDTFGEPPDVDNDPKIIILILDIIDGYNGQGGFIAGYFSPANELKPSGLAAEIYFMDANPTNLKTDGGINNALSTAAHEFQHMINWNYHKSHPENTFVNEGLSEVAQVVCGYGAEMQDLYAGEPNQYLFTWRTNDYTLVLNDYARAQRFFLYLMEQFGPQILKQCVQDYTTSGLIGGSALDKILSQNYSSTLGKVVLNWEIANGLNDKDVDPAYGYSYQPLPITTGGIFYNPNISLTSSRLQNLGAEYFTYSSSSNLSVTFSSAGTNISVKAIEIGSSSRVIDVPLNAPFTEPDYPSVYSTIRFVAIDTSQLLSQDYQYQSSGTAISTVTELKWDNTEPTGYYLWTTNDTLCVTFNPYPGGKLDSIRVALRRAGSITGGVWEYTGSPIVTPLGKELAFPITASIGTTTKVPYPVPYQNWTTVDLRSYNISTDKAFAVGFIIGSDPSTPGVMATDYKSTSSYHSYTYLQTSDQVSKPGWYYISTNDAGDTIAIYLIRAYASIVTGINKENAEIAPAAYSLSQNFPNPFNPSTNIRFDLARDGFVSLKVYDILGNEIKTLVNGFKSKGKYNIVFNATGLPSGVYFYKLKTDGYTSVKKLMLLK
jgi:hypothetical protein